MDLKIKLLLFMCYYLLVVVYGLEFIPKPIHPKSTLIWYNSSDGKSSLHYRKELDKVWFDYLEPPSDNIISCKQGIPPSEESNKFCAIDLHLLGPCVPEKDYKYNSSNVGPCVYLKSKKMSFNWVPEYYKSSTIPNDMPQDLKKHIQDIENSQGVDSNKLKVVWVTCKGENPFDVEHLGPIEFFPNFGFDGQYFPIRNEEHYLVPFVALWFKNPIRGVLINVQCKAWAKNLEDEIVHFEILVDE